jgi:hypothetical protein
MLKNFSNILWVAAGLLGVLGREFNGRTVVFLLLAWYPDASQYWIFVSGPPLGWSSRAYAGQATLYGVGTDSVTTIWKSGTLPDLKIQLNEMGWEASYDDSSRFYNNLPAPSVFDSYKFDYVTLFTDDMTKLGPQLSADVSKTSALELSDKTPSIVQGIGMG